MSEVAALTSESPQKRWWTFQPPLSRRGLAEPTAAGPAGAAKLCHIRKLKITFLKQHEGEPSMTKTVG